MKAALFLLASLFLVGLVSAGVPQDLAALQLQVNGLIAKTNVLTIKDNVREAMANYTYIFDHFVAVCGPTNNVSNPACVSALDAVMGTFCQGADFLGWNDFHQGFQIPFIPTLAGVRAFYAPLPTSFGGLSDHIISNDIVTVSADQRNATWKGKLNHPAFGGGVMTTGYGIYTNTFKVNPVNLSVCMSSFYLIGVYTAGAVPVTAQVPAQTISIPVGATSITIPAQTITVPPSSGITGKDTSRV